MVKIAICTIGSTGDVQPFLNLGKKLRDTGHRVRFCTAGMYSDLVASYELEFFPFAGDYEKLVNDEAMKKLIGKNPFTIKKKLRQHVYPIIESSLEIFYEAAKWADVIVYHPKTLIDSFGAIFHAKLIKAYVVPAFTPTRSFANPILTALPIPKFLFKASYRMVNSLMGTMKEPVKKFLDKHGIEKSSTWIETPIIYGISASVVSRPKDYPDDHHFTGFWFDEDQEAEVPREVIEFLDTKDKKLIITFGSMPYQSRIPIDRLIDDVQSGSEVRILVVRGWGLKDAKITETKNLMVIDRAPFDQLFPMADGIVHHGGAGTTAVAIRAGVPMMVCPVLHPFGDQYFWGQKIFEAGLGVAPVPLSKLTVKKFTESIDQLLYTDFSKETKKLSAAVSGENGTDKAVRLIEEHYRIAIANDNN